jgi:hypothetical protein
VTREIEAGMFKSGDGGAGRRWGRGFPNCRVGLLSVLQGGPDNVIWDNKNTWLVNNTIYEGSGTHLTPSNKYI